MTHIATDNRRVVVERELKHPPERVWRALTQPHLIEEWLLKNDFAPVVGHRFCLSADWGSVDCEVLDVQPQSKLSYTWVAMGLDSVVTCTLTPAGQGTHLQVEQAGFRSDQERLHQGALQSWPRFLATMEQVLERID